MPTIRCFDTFSGMPQPDQSQDTFGLGAYSDTSLDMFTPCLVRVVSGSSSYANGMLNWADSSEDMCEGNTMYDEQ